MVRKLTENLWAKAGPKGNCHESARLLKVQYSTVLILILVMIPASFKDNGCKTSINIAPHRYDDPSASIFDISEKR
jgi:hypothetical protein